MYFLLKVEFILVKCFGLGLGLGLKPSVWKFDGLRRGPGHEKIIGSRS